MWTEQVVGGAAKGMPVLAAERCLVYRQDALGPGGSLVWRGLLLIILRASHVHLQLRRPYVHDLRLQHLSLARLAVGSHGDACCWVPNHAPLDWPVHGTSGGSTSDSHSWTLWCPFPRRHAGPGSATANHSCMQGRGN